MAKILVSCSLFLIALFINACTRDGEVTPLEGSAVFTFSDEKLIPGGRETDVDVPAFILLSIEDGNGREVEANRKLELQPFGQHYITEAVSLAPGNYRLIKFLVLNSINTVIYAAPLEGASLAYHINDPLPLNFAVAQNKSTHVVPQVLTVKNDDTPENFGYTSFDFEVVNRDSLVLIGANVKMKVGEILYDNVDALINIKGYDSTNKVQWTRNYNFIGPSDMVLEVRNGFHHYSIELGKKWGVSDVKKEIAGKDLWKGRADGPVPITYTLLGSRKPKKLLKYITSGEVNIPGSGIVYRPEYSVSYTYKVDGHIESIHHEIYNAELSQFVESHI